MQSTLLREPLIKLYFMDKLKDSDNSVFDLYRLIVYRVLNNTVNFDKKYIPNKSIEYKQCSKQLESLGLIKVSYTN